MGKPNKKKKQPKKNKRSQHTQLATAGSSSASAGSLQSSANVVPAESSVRSVTTYTQEKIQSIANEIIHFSRECNLALYKMGDPANLSDAHQEPLAAYLAKMIPFCQQYVENRQIRMQILKNSSDKAFSEHLQKQLEGLLAYYARTYSVKQSYTELIEIFKGYHESFKSSQNGFFDEACKIVEAELGAAYIQSQQYDKALTIFEEMKDVNFLIERLYASTLISLAYYLLTFVELEFNQTTNNAQTVAVNALSTQELPAVLVRKYCILANKSRLATASCPDVDVFHIAAVFFRLAVAEKNISPDAIKKLYAAVIQKESAARKQIGALSQEKKAEYFLLKAKLLAIFIHFLKQQSEYDVTLVGKLTQELEEDIHTAHELGSKYAFYILGTLPTQNNPENRLHQQRAAAAGDAHSCHNEAYDLIEEGGLTDEKRSKEIVRLLEQAVTKGSLRAHITMGEIYSGKHYPCVIGTDNAKALEYFQFAAKYQDPMALREIGRILFLESNSAENFSRAIALWKTAKSLSPIDFESTLLLAFSYTLRIDSLYDGYEKGTMPEELLNARYELILSYAIQGLIHCRDTFDRLERARHSDDSTLVNGGSYDAVLCQIMEMCCQFTDHIKAITHNPKSQQNFLERVFDMFKNTTISISDNTIDEYAKGKQAIEAALAAEPAKAYVAVVASIPSENSQVTESLKIQTMHAYAMKGIYPEKTLAFSDVVVEIQEQGLLQQQSGNEQLNLLFLSCDLLGTQELSNVALTLYRIGDFIWFSGNMHTVLSEQHAEDIRQLIGNLFGIVSDKKYTDTLPPYALSSMCKALIGLGRLRLHPDFRLLRDAVSRMSKSLKANEAQLNLQDCIELLTAFSLLPISSMLKNDENPFLMMVITRTSQLVTEILSFIELSQLVYALAVIHSSQNSDNVNKNIETLMLALTNVYIKRIADYPTDTHLHQLILAFDYFRLVMPAESLVALFKLPLFQQMYRQVFSQVKEGQISKVQERIQGYLQALFPEVTLLSENLFGLLPGDIYHPQKHLLFEVNGNTHYLCNETPLDAPLARTPRDVFHDEYKERWYAQHGTQVNLQQLMNTVELILKSMSGHDAELFSAGNPLRIIAIPLVVIRGLDETSSEKSRVLKYVRSELDAQKIIANSHHVRMYGPSRHDPNRAESSNAVNRLEN